MRCAIVGSGLAALATYATLRHGGVAPEEIAVFGTHEDPTEVWRERAAAIRQQRMRSECDGHLAAGGVPRARGARSCARARRRRSSLGREPLPPDASTTSSRTPSRVRERSGWEQSFRRSGSSASARSTAASPLDGEGPFAHVLRRDRPSRSRATRRVPRRGARLRAARLRGEGRRRRRRDGRRDGMAERACRRRRGRLDPPARAAAPPAERAAPVLLEARPRRLPRVDQRAARGDAARALDAVLSRRAPRGTSRCARAERDGRFRVERRRTARRR